jgi:hypothetical protein
MTRNRILDVALFRLAVVALIGTAACAVPPAHADSSVSALGMGRGAPNAAEFQRYQAEVQRVDASGERFRIDTMCRSACTMFLGVRNVCITPGAKLAFHAGHTPSATQAMLGTYNAALREHVTASHFMDTSEFHVISGGDMIKRFGYRPCS